MTHIRSDIRLSQLSDFIAAQIGLHFPQERWRDLERGISSAAREFGFADMESCIQWLVSSPLTRSQIELLANHLTVGETYFFRDKNTFEILEEHILAELICSRQATERRLRIWSAGCCTGEEPYSIAIVLGKLIPDWDDWKITILGTDLNPRALQKASEAVYSQWSFRGTPESLKETYFRRESDGRLSVVPLIRKRVSFAYLNLADDAYPCLTNNTGAMDVIFCRNVLIYFSPEIAQKVIRKFFRSLVNGGWLVVSASETSQALFSEFETIQFPGATLYRKNPDASQTAVGVSGVWRLAPQALFPEIMEPIGELNPAPQPRGQMSEPLSPVTGGAPTPETQLSAYDEGLLMYEQGNYAEAAERLCAWLFQNREDANALSLLARVYANQGNLTEALEWSGRAIAADKVNAAHYYLRATIFLEQGSLEQARASLQQTLYLDQDFVLAHFALGNLAVQQRKLKESGKHFGNALLLLATYRAEDNLAESDGITAGRLIEIIHMQRTRTVEYERQPI
jgi:chemotaxis protein methyltransferase CheR